MKAVKSLAKSALDRVRVGVSLTRTARTNIGEGRILNWIDLGVSENGGTLV